MKTALIMGVLFFGGLLYQGYVIAVDSGPQLATVVQDQNLVRLARKILKSDRDELIRVMKRAAQKARVNIDTGTLVIGSQDGLSLVNTTIQGFEAIEIDDFKNGADVGFIFFDGPQTRDAPALSPGFYTVRVFEDLNGEFMAGFVNRWGEEVTAVPVQVTTKVVEPEAEIEIVEVKSTVCNEIILGLGWNIVKVDAGLVAFDAFQVALDLAAPSPGPLEDKYCGEGSGPGGTLECDAAFIQSCRGTYHPPGELGEHHTWGTCIEPT